MIIELCGLPGSGKTSLAEALKAKGAILVSMPSRTRLVYDAGLFWLAHPLLAFRVLSSIFMRAPRGMRYELIINGYLGYAARFHRAEALSRTGAIVILDQGFFQLSISLGGLPITLLETFPKPDLLTVVETEVSEREQRMTSRGWAPRAKLGTEGRLAWQKMSETSFLDLLPLIEDRVRVYRYDGAQNPEAGAIMLMATIAQEKPATMQMSSLRNLFKTTLTVVSFLVAQVARVFRHTQQVVVLMYHSVDRSGWKLSVTPEEFERHMAYLARKGWAVPLADIVAYVKGEKKLPAHAIAVTFDDGYRDLLATVLPILERYNIPTAVFVPSDLSARTDPDYRPRLTEEELRTISRSSLITIGSHAKSHIKFTELTPEKIRNEARESADGLAQITGERPNFFAYPFGARSAEAERAVENAGFEAAFGISEGTIHQGDNLFCLKRVQIDSTMNFLLFRLRLTSAVDYNRRLVDLFRSS